MFFFFGGGGHFLQSLLYSFLFFWWFQRSPSWAFFGKYENNGCLPHLRLDFGSLQNPNICQSKPWFFSSPNQPKNVWCNPWSCLRAFKQKNNSRLSPLPELLFELNSILPATTTSAALRWDVDRGKAFWLLAMRCLGRVVAALNGFMPLHLLESFRHNRLQVALGNMMGMKCHCLWPGLAFVFFKDYTARLYGDYNKH